ncbi:ribonuclease VapC [Desulfosarcina ovata subsp. sediminis]|uniref:Ribonuclease VapC n=1 Tax=Desulfosarcina ovata subsp. sediminis TaxID=885957 RepID=A0A5K7ZZ09_9BACT|nr:type II toxin-antitoxin system VapC family toxin [Desulfosarcina ovata]BBO85340.1 ribonuclease VapC [Desulfosarcina ovata subsp. sediminis]
MKIVADTSAFIAILQKEQDADIYRQTLMEAEKILVSTATAVELHIVVTSRLGAEGILRFNHLLAQPLFEIMPVDVQQMALANQAYERFGKGRHPARLNYGDLFSYALAKSRNLPLLFKGDDFSKTDLVSCL